MSKFVSIPAAAKALGVSPSILGRWEAAGKLVPIRIEGGQHRDDLAAMRPERFHGAQVLRRTLAYSRVSSDDQKADLERQRQSRSCAAPSSDGSSK